MVNAVLIFLSAALSLHGILMPRNRTSLRLFSWLVIVCAALTLVLGLDIWFATLQTKANLGKVWALLSSNDQSLLQQQVRHPDQRRKGLFWVL
jgi:hypothetical protein